jgi:hypothetical protein
MLNCFFLPDVITQVTNISTPLKNKIIATPAPGWALLLVEGLAI